jgi:hypothetical protein
MDRARISACPLQVFFHSFSKSTPTPGKYWENNRNLSIIARFHNAHVGIAASKCSTLSEIQVSWSLGSHYQSLDGLQKFDISFCGENFKVFERLSILRIFCMKSVSFNVITYDSY